MTIKDLLTTGTNSKTWYNHKNIYNNGEHRLYIEKIWRGIGEYSLIVEDSYGTIIFEKLM